MGVTKFAWRQKEMDKSRRIQNIRGPKTENPGKAVEEGKTSKFGEIMVVVGPASSKVEAEAPQQM